MKKISFVFLVLAIVLVFRNFFLPGVLVWGDAPYLYPEGLSELLGVPSLWTTTGNSLGGVNLFIWIHPLMLIYAVLGTVFNLTNDLILRIVFYLPSLLIGLVGVIKFVSYLKFSKTVAFFGSLFYLINTYYLLLVDGGQVGVVLAYGLFPLVLFLLLKASDISTLKNVSISLIASFVLTIVDFRISAICFLVGFLFKLFAPKKIKIQFLILISTLGLGMYWIIPALKLATGGLGTQVSGLQTTSLLNTLFLVSPNWPSNEFGKSIPPAFYFFVLPVFIFLPLFFIKTKKIIWLSLLFLFFAFLTKGESEPLAYFYKFFVNTQFGSIFRDSTKFFTPLILISGTLIGIAIEWLVKKIKLNTNIQYTLYFILFLALVWQAIFGKLNGTLGNAPDIFEYKKIAQQILVEDGFLRSAWFIEKSPFAYHTSQKQALDAKSLVEYRPFASFNAGTGDKFNFVNNDLYLDFFDLLGIRYLIFNGNPRVKNIDETAQKDWTRLLGLISRDKRLQKQNWGVSFPIYENIKIHPNQFFVDKTFVVLGGDDVYKKLKTINPNFSVGNQGMLFIEDGKLDPYIFQNIDPSSLVTILNNKTEIDLKMSYLQKYFVNMDENKYTQWAVRNASDYLSWKYELLTREVDTKEYDYGKGIAFSTEANEVMEFELNSPENGEYYFVIRSMMGSNSMDLVIELNNQEMSLPRQKEGQFEWLEFGPIYLTSGSRPVKVRNLEGFNVLNTLGLVPAGEMRNAEGYAQNFLQTFDYFDIDIPEDSKVLGDLINDTKWSELPTEANLNPGWVIFTDSYHPAWEAISGNKKAFSVPMYSMINGFYTDSNLDLGNVKISFSGDINLRWGLYWSVLSCLVIFIFILYNYAAKSDKNKNN